MIRPFIILSIGIISLLTSCSTQKNTFVNRNFHNINAKYNVLFNGKESYKEGALKIDKSYKENYSFILPIFKNNDPDAAKTATSSFERTIEKSTKCINKHSIKAKPKNLQNKTNLTERDRKELEKVEYNRFVDDAYMYIGKSHFAKQDYVLAIETFKFMQKEFKSSDKIFYNSTLWLIRSMNELKNFRDAKEEIEKINKRKNLKVLINNEYYAVIADYYLKQKQFSEAAENLEKSLALEKKRKNKIRYSFILAQIYQEIGRNTDAGKLYEKVIKMNPPYEMSFNSKIRLANTFSGGDAGRIKKILADMLDDEKNDEFQDQIYYALGQTSQREANINDALNYYKKSTEVSINNNIQKTNSFLAIAEIYFNKRDFRNAGNYYDSASITITENFPEYEAIKSRMSLLIELVENLNTIDLEDSLQILARLPKEQLNKKIDKMVADYNEQQRIEQIKEMQRMQELSYITSRQNTTQTSQQATKWYFYNTTTLQAGKKEFIVRWPNRKPDDNWRRKNKESVLKIGKEVGEEGETSEEKPKIEYAPNQREYYLENVPLTDSSLNASQEREKNCILAAAFIYRADLNEGRQALLLYENLTKKYPNDEYAPLAYYQSYKLCKDLNDLNCAEKNKAMILSKYANTNFAKAILDPGYLESIKSDIDLFEDNYTLALSNYRNGNTSAALSYIAEIDRTFTNHKEYYKVAYLKILCTLSTMQPTLMRKTLRQYIQTYPSKSTTKEAQGVLAYIDAKFPEASMADNIEQAKDLYVFNKSEEHMLFVVVPAEENTKQIEFNFMEFNLDNYDSLNLTISNITLTEKQNIIIIERFTDINLYSDYYGNVKQKSNDLLKGTKLEKLNFMLISRSNFEILKQDKDVAKYNSFFLINYSFIRP